MFSFSMEKIIGKLHLRDLWKESVRDPRVEKFLGGLSQEKQNIFAGDHARMELMRRVFDGLEAVVRADLPDPRELSLKAYRCNEDWISPLFAGKRDLYKLLGSDSLSGYFQGAEGDCCEALLLVHPMETRRLGNEVDKKGDIRREVPQTWVSFEGPRILLPSKDRAELVDRARDYLAQQMLPDIMDVFSGLAAQGEPLTDERIGRITSGLLGSVRIEEDTLFVNRSNIKVEKDEPGKLDVGLSQLRVNGSFSRDIIPVTVNRRDVRESVAQNESKPRSATAILYGIPDSLRVR